MIFNKGRIENASALIASFQKDDYANENLSKDEQLKHLRDTVALLSSEIRQLRGYVLSQREKGLT